MNSEDCSTDCAELPIIPVGKLVVIATGTFDGTDYTTCKFNLIKDDACAYPAIPVATDATHVGYKDGSALFPIEVPMQVAPGGIIKPLIMDGAGVIKGYKANPIPGKMRIISKGGSIQGVPYIFPGLISDDLEEMDNPDFYLGANAVTRICDPLDSPAPIQLLRISSVATIAAVDDDITVEYAEEYNFDAIANDTGTGISITSVTQPTHGTVTIEMDGTLTYTPDLDYDGPDSFTYTITDADLHTDTATVDVTVNPIAHPYYASAHLTGSGGSTYHYLLIQEPLPSIDVRLSIPLPDLDGLGSWDIPEGYYKSLTDFTIQLYTTSSSDYTGGSSAGVRQAGVSIP